MTPQEAQKLLDAATPGPWGVESGVAGAAVYSKVGVVCDGTGVDDATLIAAAPDLAETVANMRYEYAVQANGHEWVRENDEGRFVLTFDPTRALRAYHPGVAAEIAKVASARFSCECRVVRRLASDVEVVE